MRKIHWTLASQKHWNRVLVAPVIGYDNRVVVHSTIEEYYSPGDPLADYEMQKHSIRYIRPLELNPQLWYTLANQRPLTMLNIQRYSDERGRLSTFAWLPLLETLTTYTRDNHLLDITNIINSRYYANKDVLIWITNVLPISTSSSIFVLDNIMYSALIHSCRCPTTNDDSLTTKWSLDISTSLYRRCVYRDFKNTE